MYDGEREWWVAQLLAERSGEPVQDCLRTVKRLGWEFVGSWLFKT